MHEFTEKDLPNQKVHLNLKNYFQNFHNLPHETLGVRYRKKDIVHSIDLLSHFFLPSEAWDVDF